MTTLLFDDHRGDANLELRSGAPWIRSSDLEAATGWHLEDRGVCRGAQCVPVPPGESWTDGEHFALGAFAAHRGQGQARDTDRDVWAFGPAVAAPFAGAEAPDFELPDFEGKLHRLSDYRGQKVLLMTWASW